MVKRKRDDQVPESQEPASVLKLDDSINVDTPFPRGGGSGVTPLEIRQATTQATRDVFDERTQKKRKQKTKAPKLPVGGPRSDKPRVEYFILSKLKVGTLSLGQISEVHSGHIIVSLPNNVIGFLQNVDTGLYKVGEWLRFVVAGLEGSAQKRLQLVIEPALVNQAIAQDDYLPGMAVQGTIKSSEDKGYILDLGGKSAFLPHKYATTAANDMQVGKVILATLKSEKNGVYTLTQKRDSKPLATVHEQSSLVPGVLVDAQVSSSLRGGYMCSVFGHIDISLADNYAQDVEEGATEEARILFSHPADSPTETKRVLALSCLAATRDLAVPEDSKAFNPGQILEDCRVTKITDSGLFLNIGVTRPAFVYVSNIADTRIEDLSKYPNYKVGTIHKARVLSYSYVDDMYYVSMQPSVLAQKHLSVDEIEVGEVMEGVVDRFLPKGGVIIAFGEKLKGICPEIYLSDAALANPEKKFKTGQKVTARVVSTNPDEGKFKLAMKKSIVNSDADIISEFPETGDKSIGTIVSLKDRGAVVEFFNDIKGFLPAKEMSESNITDPKSHFKLGQSVSVTVLSADPSQDRLILTCRASRTAAEGPEPNLLDQVKAVVTEKLNDSYAIQIEGHPGVLPFELLADKPSEVKAAKKGIKIGSSIDVLVLQNGYPTILATTKPLLLANNPPTDLKDLSKGEQVYGYVRSVSEHGVFIAFANKLVGLLPEAIVGNHKYVKGESVCVYVSAIDAAQKRFLVSPNGPQKDSASSSGEDAPKVGDKVTAVVTAVKPMQLNVTVGESQGRLEMTQIFDDIQQVEDVKRPLAQFSKGDKIKCSVIGYHDARNHKFLPISHRTGSHVVLELSALKKQPKFNNGDKALAFINNFNSSKDQAFVSLSPTASSRLALCDLTADIAELEKLDENFPVGRVIEATVYSSSPLAVSAANGDTGKQLAVITKVMPTQLYVKLPQNKSGIVAAVDALDTFEPLAKHFKVRDIVSGKVIEHDESNEKTWFSLKDNDNAAAETIKSGDIVRGYIKNVADGGVFVQLARNLTGRIQISQLSDDYLKDWKKHYKVGQVVEAKVISSGSRVELTLKQSAISGKSQGQAGIEDLEEGSVLTGTVRSVQDYGVFVGLDGLSLSGLCHKSQVADKDIPDLSKVFNKGDPVKVKVLEVDLDKRKISLGMKASYFGDAESESESESDQEQGSEDGSESEDDSQEMEIEDFNDNEISLPSDDDDEDSSDAEMDVGNGVSAGFDWNADILNEQQGSDDSDSSDDEDQAPRKRKRAEKFTEDKTATLASRAPQSAQDFERLLVSNPGSSVMWMNYMAFQIQLSEIEAAREIARRALKTIPIREEEEKQNIWIALLNLENSFGTEETTQEIFKEACTFMDPLTMHKKMAGIYSSSDKVDAAKRVWNTACKKFGSDDLEVWTMYSKFLFDSGSPEEARKLLERAIKVLPSRVHKDITLQFAKLEYSQGDAERGRTLMEGLVSAYPRKIDLWNVYSDQELKSPENRAAITRLFERILKLKLTTKQAKLFFKKWLSYEVEHGDTTGVDYVKSKAQKYVNNN